VPSAVEQLDMARKAKDASFYDQAVIDARERELNERQKADKKEKKER
jgi:predicted Zn-dependent protease